MNPLALLKWAFLNLQRNRRRSLITGLSILSGFAGLVLLAGYVHRVERFLMVNTVYLNHTSHIVVYKKDGLVKYLSNPRAFLISKEEIQKAAQVFSQFTEKIEHWSAYLATNGIAQNENQTAPFQAVGISSETDNFVFNHPMVRKWTDELQEKQKTLVSSDQGQGGDSPVALATELNEKLHKPSVVQLWGQTLDGGFNAIDSQVQFTYSTGLELLEATSLKASLSSFQKLLETDGATYLGVYLQSDDQTSSVLSQLRAAFEKEHLPFEAHPYYDDRIGLFYVGTMGFLNGMAAFFLVLVSSVVILSVTNSISMSIIERVREIGTLRSLGYQVSLVSFLFTLEYLILGLISLALGALVSEFTAVFTNHAGILFKPPGIAGTMKFLLVPTLTHYLMFGGIILFLVAGTAQVVTRKKLRVSAAQLLTETTS